MVTLRNEVSHWLTIPQVVPEGWTFPELQPGQYISIGLPGSAPQCALAEPESTPPEPDQWIRRAYCIASSADNPEMIESMTALLVRDGYAESTPSKPGQIHVERYWLKGGGFHPDNT